MAQLVISLVDKWNKHVKRVAIQMPEGFEWEEENAKVVDFIGEHGEVYVVCGLQINAVNTDVGKPRPKKKRKRPGS